MSAPDQRSHPGQAGQCLRQVLPTRLTFYQERRQYGSRTHVLDAIDARAYTNMPARPFGRC